MKDDIKRFPRPGGIYLVQFDGDDPPSLTLVRGPYRTSRHAEAALQQDEELAPGFYYTVRVQTRLELCQQLVRSVHRQKKEKT